MNNPKFAVGLMIYYSRELRKIEVRMKNLAHMNLRDKVAESLILMMKMFGVNKENEINVSLTRKDIADTIGTNIEQVSRQLSEFNTEGLIKKMAEE